MPPTAANDGYNWDSADPNIAVNRILREFTAHPAADGSGLDLFAEPMPSAAIPISSAAFPKTGQSGT